MPEKISPSMRAALDQASAHLAEARADLEAHLTARAMLDSLDEVSRVTPRILLALAAEIRERHGE
ncbi:hypothetical protein [Streptosporangium sp. NPDC002524]|uniref:hypothetical protein n=1 Tax=Streptosporangium sp. NPDC002524 TaxID=3154537 RepID=UPI003316562E